MFGVPHLPNDETPRHGGRQVQVTLVQIDNYGPWTVDPEPRPETDIQSLQSNLYADLCQLFGTHDCLVFYGRFDNVLAVTNGTTKEQHRGIQESIGNRYPVTVSMGIGSGGTPSDAVEEASAALQRAGSAQDAGRKQELVVESLGGGGVEVAHFDGVDATGNYTDELNAYEALISMEKAYTELMTRLWHQHDGMSFFVGGDNVVSVTPGLDSDDYHDLVSQVREASGVRLKVGVGSSELPSEAGIRAKMGLETCRESGDTVCFYDSSTR